VKVKLIDRLLLTVYTLIIIFASALILVASIAIGIDVFSLDAVNASLSNLQLNWKHVLIAALISLLFLTVSIKLLFLRTRPKALSSSLLRNTELGAIRVSVTALEIMAQKAVRSFDEVKDVKINILTQEDGIKIQLKLLMMPEVVLPDISPSIQQKVQEYIQSYSGILVKEVFIYIDNLTATQQRPKVQ